MKLMFVYKADSGFFNTVADIAHKITSPETYPCKLCSLTHGYFSIRDQWQRFLHDTDKQCVFYHRDEFTKHYGATEIPLPAIFIETSQGPELFIDKEKLEALDDVQQLIELIKAC